MITSRHELAALRLVSQSVAARSFEHPADVVRGMLAMQAQDFPGAKWSIGLRLPGSTDAAIESAITAGEIVRSWPIRGTLHFLAPEDVSWMLRISVPRLASRAAKRREDLAITDSELARAGELARELLTGGRALRRDRLLEAWTDAGIPTTGQRGYHLLWNLGHGGLIVFGPADGKHPTFTLLEEWAPNQRALEGDEALGEFARRYFASHGPATLRDFAWWASLTLRDARIGLALAVDGLETLEFEGATYYLRPGLAVPPKAVHALPGFDEFMLGYQDRSAALAAEHSERIVPGKNGIFLPTIVVNGEIVGTWRRTETAKKAVIEPIPFDTLRPGTVAGLERALTRYGTFLGKRIEVRG